MGAVVAHPVWLDETPDGVKVADVAWAPSAFFAQHEFQVPYSVAPAIFVEIKSRANARVEPLAKELWLIDAKGRVTFRDRRFRSMCRH
jgi:hypothetical protein